MTTPARLQLTIYQGATFREALERLTVPYPVRWDCGQLVDACSGARVPDADITLEDYTGCTARVQLRRDIDDTQVLLELTTENGGIELDGAWLRLVMTAAQTAALEFGDAPPAWTSCIGQVEVVRPSGDVERQYELAFELRQEATR
ncbi:hypothetical protein [Delftia acidovorans]|uniref:hypothetical protein n=1 Tax=Delftia acidovorans TaxID=80866 RepID=UPI000BC4833A|nr:hypothetical protein [Delftia acidovorans]SOE37545.1 hypothetical protein SAMN05216519_3594 [Delftia acidovorans]